MKTLVIHPHDPTTDFLGHIYFDKDWTVFRSNLSKKHLVEAIKEHERIIMLGHGTEYGLIGWGRLVIDSSWVWLLREKQIVAIWCNADVFVQKYDLNGLYTGMIISEHEEAAMFALLPYTMKDIKDSNELFAVAMKEAIQSPAMVESALVKYVGSDNPIINFNRQNIHERGTTKERLHD